MNKMHKIMVILMQVAVIGSFLAACQAATPVPQTSLSAPTTAPTSPAANSGEVILTTGDWPPYVFEQGSDPGPIAAIITAAFKEAGITPKFVFYPWKRAEDEVRQGNAFAAFPYAVTTERQKEFDFSDPMYTVQSKFFYHKKYHPDGIPFEKLEDLRSYRIGGLLGSWYETTFKEAGLQVEYTASMDQSVDKLALGRIDLAVEEENTVWDIIRKKYPNEVDQFATLPKSLEHPGLRDDLSLLVSRSYPNSAELLAKFNTGLAAIRANGTYKQILEKYKLAPQE
jgi:polar amino acid transport system substrate-binding protein